MTLTLGRLYGDKLSRIDLMNIENDINYDVNKLIDMRIQTDIQLVINFKNKRPMLVDSLWFTYNHHKMIFYLKGKTGYNVHMFPIKNIQDKSFKFDNKDVFITYRN